MAVTPVFVFDTGELWFPVGVEESLAAVAPMLWGPDGPLDEPAGVEHLTDRFVRIDFPAGMTQPDLPAVGYHRVVDQVGLHWHQYWLWYLYNPWSVAGVGRHEGDWEFVQLACTDPQGDKPVLATYSQHHTGGKREFWALSHNDDGRPFVYVAKGSHANYFSPLAAVEDECDAGGPVLADVEWRDFGAWALWTGRWGNSTGEGKSPESPGQQHVRWDTPHLFHAAAH
jgi:hypothetical protein